MQVYLQSISEKLKPKYALGNILSVGGKACWSFLGFKDTDVYSQWELKTLFLQEVFARGILTIGSHNMTYAHSDSDISNLLKVYDEVFAMIKEILTKRNLNELLQTEPLVPLFKIR